MSAAREDIRGRMARRIGMLRFVLDHPVNRGHRARAIARYVGWQAWRHLVRRPMTVSYWNGLRVRVYPDWPYSWTAIYVRLTEYDDMMFTLRYLRPGDAFIDVGANIGFYSLLAPSANAGAPVLAIEPHPVASGRLRENARLNSFRKIHVREAAAGEIEPASVAMVKVDAEGFEANVLSGARRLLDAEPGPLWMVELSGLGTRYGSDDAAVHAIFRECGYRPLRYFAADNRVEDLAGAEPAPRNVIFARRPDSVATRLAASAAASVPTS